MERGRKQWTRRRGRKKKKGRREREVREEWESTRLAAIKIYGMPLALISGEGKLKRGEKRRRSKGNDEEKAR